MDYYGNILYTNEAMKEALCVGILPICKYVIREISYTGWLVHKKEMMQEILQKQQQWEKTMITLLLRRITNDPLFEW